MLTTVFFHYYRKKKKNRKKGFFVSKEVLFKDSNSNKDQIILHINLVVTSDGLCVHIYIGTQAHGFRLPSNLSPLYCEMLCNYIV